MLEWRRSWLGLWLSWRVCESWIKGGAVAQSGVYSAIAPAPSEGKWSKLRISPWLEIINFLDGVSWLFLISPGQVYEPRLKAGDLFPKWKWEVTGFTPTQFGEKLRVEVKSSCDPNLIFFTIILAKFRVRELLSRKPKIFYIFQDCVGKRPGVHLP